METDYNENEKLKKDAPNLFKIEKKEVFFTPVNYFEQLPGIMQDRVHAEKLPQVSWISNYKFTLAAVSACVILFILFKINEQQVRSKNEVATSDILQAYDVQYLASADETELAEQLDDESLEMASEQLEHENEISNKEIEEYLLNNNIDIPTLTNEF